MSGDLPIIDVHNHVYPTAELGRRNQEAVGREAIHDGTVEEMRRLGRDAGITHSAIILFVSAGRMFEARLPHLPIEPAARKAGLKELKAMLTQRIIRYNDWGISMLESYPELLPFIGVDPVIMGREAMLVELEDKLRRGAKGVKIHPSNIGVYLNDPRLWPVYEFCDRTGLPLLTQSGSGGLKRDLGGFSPMGRIGYLAPALEEFKNLKVIAAHFNLGCDPEEIVELARRFPGFYTDLSNQLIDWDQPGAWTVDEGVAWIRKAGPEKVLFGSNYLVGDPQDIARKLRGLPMDDSELELIANANAKAIFGLS